MEDEPCTRSSGLETDGQAATQQATYDTATTTTMTTTTTQSEEGRTPPRGTARQQTRPTAKRAPRTSRRERHAQTREDRGEAEKLLVLEVEK